MSSGGHNSEASTSNFLLGAFASHHGNSSKYRAYASAVDKVLKSFESSTEWADLIAALGKLGKVFASNSKSFNDIPNSLTVAKRLSQCLHPALPSGVHSKALETYRQVFNILGHSGHKQNLARSLFLYAIGLFPLMDHCGIKVKSELLSIFEHYLLPLGPDLRPALPGFITAVLLALEEGTEFYGRAFQLLEQLMDKVGSDAFYACYWQAVGGSSSVRLPALIFINAKLEKRKSPQSSSELLHTLSGGGQASAHMLRALCAVADDTGSALVQRHLLDFLCTAIPLDSDWVPRTDLIQLLRRCMFVVLRRDMSLNRRLYQWLLNRSNDGAFVGLPVNGAEDSTDLAFFKKYTLPLLKLAIREYLRSAETVEVPPLSTGTIRRYGTLMKDPQIQFPEVRICRLLHYMLDRPELGQLVLNESLADLLETICLRDGGLIIDLQKECEQFDPNFDENFWDLCSIVPTKNNDRDDPMNQRTDEIKKNFNVLLKSLELNYIWNFFKQYFTALYSQEGQESPAKEREVSPGEESRQLSPLSLNSQCTKNSRATLFPLMVAFCIRNLQLDSHCDIRGCHLPSLLQCILNEIATQQQQQQSNGISTENTVACLAICRRLLAEITQNNLSMVFETIHENLAECSPSKRGAKCNKELAEEQRLVEHCLAACLRLLSTFCDWYASERECRKVGVLNALCALLRDFGDFPFYSLHAGSDQQSPCKSLTDSLRSNCVESTVNVNTFPGWLTSLLGVVDPNSWINTKIPFDLELRNRLFELVLYLCVRSVSMIEQHAAVFGRAKKGGSNRDDPGKGQKTTTTVLLKPFMGQTELTRIEKEGLYKKAASVLWRRFGDNTEPANLQHIALLLLRLHSRRVSDASSEVEDIIVSELTSCNKVLSGEAARKFHDLWVFCRNAMVEEVYSGIALKSMNRVVMVLLGYMADDNLGAEQVELRALAYSWFLDCARHNDLHQIIQMLTLMLLNPATARVSIQFVQMSKRITQDQLPLMPAETNCVALTTMSGKQTFHHVCTDVERRTVPSSGEQNQSYSYVDCNPRHPWVSELNKQLLLLPYNSNNISNDNVFSAINQQQQQYSNQQQANVLPDNSKRQVVDSSTTGGGTKSHRRTMSDIPQFDGDAESMDSYSLDTSLDLDVLECVQMLVDNVCEQYADDEEEGNDDEGGKHDGEDEGIGGDMDESQNNNNDSNNQETPTRQLKGEQRATAAAERQRRQFANRGGDVFVNNNQSASKLIDEKQDRSASSAQEADDQISLVGLLLSPAHTAAAVPRISAYAGGETIRRVRTGHRRQDSLQESIFSTGTQELRLFDPTELPNSTCPGDYKQPLLDETFSHMLFYAESPSIVDLGRAEKLFRTIGALLKSGNGLGKHLVNSMLFTSMSASATGSASTSNQRTVTTTTTIGGANNNQQLVDFMARHYRHIQGEGFWTEPSETGENNKTQHHKQSTLFEVFSTVILYFFRSYYLNSPTNYVSETDLMLSWKCKIAALDCFTELLQILDTIVKEVSSKELATFVQQIYRQTKTQKVVLTLMLAAIPTPPSQKAWKMPLTMDIAEFNNGPHQRNGNFRELVFAYHRSLLSLATALVVLEYSLHVGMRHFSSQNNFDLPLNFAISGGSQITENQINYNSSQNRSTIREARYSVVELRLFLGVILNALKRCPERHELWLQFLIGILPYLDRALATFVVHVVEQICRNLYECVFINGNLSSPSTPSALNTPLSSHIVSLLEHPKSPVQFVDYRIGRANDYNSAREENGEITSSDTKYPANYILTLIESLMSISHFCLLDNSPSLMTPMGPSTAYSYQTSIHHQQSLSRSSNGTSATTTTSSGGGGMTSMVGSAISVIPGTGLINNLFGRVFTSGENPSNVTSRADSNGKSPQMLEAQKELIKRFPSSLAILIDVWAYTVNREQQRGNRDTDAIPQVGAYRSLSTLILDILNPIAKRHKNALMNSLGVVWMFRSHGGTKTGDLSQCSFAYSSQQEDVAKLALSLKTLSLTSIICSISDTLKESANKSKSAISGDKLGGSTLELAMLELLHQCTRQVSVNELRESWAALNILFNDSPLSYLPARASFLEFIILTDFVRRCGNQAIIEDKQISKAILDVCQKLVDAVNSIVGWQLETTTWLKRTLVVRQDATTQKSMSSDLSPVLEQRGSSVGGSGTAPPSGAAAALSASALASETNSMRGSTISLSGLGPSRLSSTLDITNEPKKTSSGTGPNLRSSLKDSSSTTSSKKDPHDSTQALFLLAENLTELIDLVCRNEDREKLLPSLQAVWSNTLPYLKSKSAKNVRFFLASSQFLASMSSYNYMRSVWKKNAMDLLWDSSFFKMDIHALRQWLIVIDNLMTNDKTSFKELLTRITTSTSTTLSTLITSKEQEYEMRAQYLKRLAFVILSSDLDQYSGQLSDIHERLTENLRLCQVPVIHTQVFTCYRVLLIRMSPSSFVSIWPSIVTELVQVLAQIEHQLSLAASNPASSIDEQKSVRDEQCMQLFLAACKLLETLCTLPSGYVTQFQMCRWTFISPMNTNSMSDVFVPYAFQLNRLLNSRYAELTGEDLEMRSASLFSIKTLTSYQELHPFFHALSMQNNNRSNSTNGGVEQLHNGQMDGCEMATPDGTTSVRLRDDQLLNGSLTLKNAVARIEHSLYVDFAEHWQL